MAASKNQPTQRTNRARSLPTQSRIVEKVWRLICRATVRSAIAALPYLTLSLGFLLVCGLQLSFWGLEPDYFKQVLVFQILSMHAGLFLGGIATVRPKSIPGHGIRLVAFCLMCALYTVAGHQEDGLHGIILIWSLILFSCLGVFLGAINEQSGKAIMGRSVISMVMLFLVLIPFGVWNMAIGVQVESLEDYPLIGFPYFGILAFLELFRFAPGAGTRFEKR